MEFEDFFKLEIPDLDAAKLATIADVVNYISDEVVFAKGNRSIKDGVFKDLAAAFNRCDIIISYDRHLFEIIAPDNKGLWKKVSANSKYDLPLPDNFGAVGKWLGKFFQTADNYDNVTIDRYLDLICAVNYATLVPLGEVQNKYEVMIAVMGITIEKLGVSPFEVFWESSFTKDLGVD